MLMAFVRLIHVEVRKLEFSVSLVWGRPNARAAPVALYGCESNNEKSLLLIVNVLSTRFSLFKYYML